MTNNTFSQTGKTYLLIHGAWHGAWCWNKVVPLMQAKGNKVIAMDLPGHGDHSMQAADITLADYVTKVVEIATAQKGPVILVGHSMAGIVISQAAEELGSDKISALIYLDAFVPKNGESLFSLAGMIQAQLPPNAIGNPTFSESIIPSADHKTNSFNPQTADWFFYHDCTEADKQFALTHISKEPVAPMATPVNVTDPIYGIIPKYYILCTESKDLDKTLLTTHVPYKKIYKLPTSHSPFFSRPEALVEILNEIQ